MLLVFLTHFLFPTHKAEQVNIRNCTTLQLHKNEFYIGSFDSIFLESKDLNFSMPQLQQNMMVEAQIIQNCSDQDVIVLATFANANNNQSFINQFCWLNKNTTAYYITCKRRMFKYLVDNQIVFDSEVTSQIKYLTQENDTCEHLFINEQQIINIFCFSNSNIHYLSINLDRNTSQYAYNNTLSTYINSCSRQILKTSQEDQFIIAFTKCKYWSVFLYKGFSIQKIIDINNLTNHDTISENNQLTNIQLCQNNLYLIFMNQYLVIDIELVSIQFMHVTQERYQIFTLLFQDTCLVYSQVLISETASQQISVINESIYISIAQIPQNIYYSKNLLIVQYSSHILVMMNQRIIQNYQWKLSSLVYDTTYNIFYGYDFIQKSIKVFKLYLKQGYFQYNSYKYFLETSENNLLLEENYPIFNCFQVIEQDNSEFDGNIMKFNIEFVVGCLHQNYISSQFSKVYIKSNVPIAVKVAPNSRIVSISDREELEFICQPKMKRYNSKDSSYILTYYNKGLLSQQFVWKNDEKYIIQLCKGEQIQQSQVYNQEQTTVFYYQGTIIFVQFSIQEVKIYNFQSSLDNYKIIKLPEKITQAMKFDDYIVLQTENKNHTYVINSQISLSYFEKFEQQFKESQVLYFKEKNQNYLIQYEKDLYIIFQESHSAFSFRDQLIIYSKIQKSLIVIYAIDKYQNRIIKYLYVNQELILQEYLNLNYYQKQIYFPIKVQCNQRKIVITAKNESGQFFLLIINLTTRLAQSLEQIIEISRLEFFVTYFFLFFYDKDFKIQIFQFQYLNFKMDIQNIDSDQNLVTFNESLLYYSQVQPFKEFNYNITISISNLCKNINKLPISQRILHSKQKSTISLNLQDYFSGPIEKVKILNTMNLKLHGPFLYRQKLQQCNTHQDSTLCIQTCILQYQENTTLKIYFVQIENEYFILNDYHFSLNITIIQIYHLEQDQFLVIYHHSEMDLCIFVFYEFNLLTQRYFQKSIQNYECKQVEMKCKKQGNILMLKFQELVRFFLIFEQQITELHFQGEQQFNDFFIINNTPNQFLFLKNHVDFSFCLMSVYYLDQNQLHFNSSYKLDNDKFQLELLQNELQQQIQFKFMIIHYKSFKIEQQCITSKIVVSTYKTTFIGFVKCFIQDKECIYSVSKTLKTPDNVSIQNKLLFEEDFIYISINQNYYLYDLKLKNNINYIASLQSDYEIITFNTTHYLIVPLNYQGDVYIGQIGYEISLLENGQSQKEIEFNLLVYNEISEEQVSLIFFNDDLDGQTQMKTKYLICSINMIFIILMIYFTRRSKLKLQNQEYKTNDKQ